MNIFKYLAKIILLKPLYNALIFLVWLMPGRNLGLAIIGLTIITRLILLPSSIKATVSQRRLKELQPEMDKIREKYKDDKQGQSKALLEFYFQHKINPLGSCLPLLIQFPILIILYYVFRIGVDTSRFDLLYGFMPRPETVNSLFLGINLAKPDPHFILPIIAGLSQLAVGLQMRADMPKPKKDASQAEQMQGMLGQQMIFLTPLLTFFIAMKLPSALPLYWIAYSLFMIIQQWLIMKGKLGGQKATVKIREKVDK